MNLKVEFNVEDFYNLIIGKTRIIFNWIDNDYYFNKKYIIKIYK